MEDQIDTLDDGSHFLSSDEIGFDKLAVGINVLLLPTKKVVCAYDFVPLADQAIDQPGPHETRTASYEYLLGFQVYSLPPRTSLFKFMLYLGNESE